MIADHIEDLITATKALPNSLHRNKIVSHLEDAKAHAIALDIKIDIREIQEPSPFDGKSALDYARGCICHKGMTDKQCPIHGYGVKNQP